MSETTLTRDKSFMGLFLDDSREKVRVLQNLYESDIAFSIHALLGSGWVLYIGGRGPRDVHRKATGNADSFDEAIMWLAEKACELYPKSKFAQYYAHESKVAKD